jgi:hypothetical protein
VGHLEVEAARRVVPSVRAAGGARVVVAHRPPLDRATVAERIPGADAIAPMHDVAAVLAAAGDDLPRAPIALAALPSIEALRAWPRWDRGLSNVDLGGLPLDEQPHPWNAPRPAESTPSELAAWHVAVGPLIGATIDAVAAITRPPGAWDRDGMDVLGRMVRGCLEAHGLAPSLIIRAAPAALLAPSVLDSLAVLPVHRLEVLAGSLDDDTLERLGCDHDAFMVDRALARAAEVGLAPRTRLCLVLGLPDELADVTVATLHRAASLVARRSAAELRVEWWLDLPGSPLHRPHARWHERLLSAGLPCADEALLPAQAPWALELEQRRAIAEAIEVLRLTRACGRCSGPWPVARAAARSTRAAP